MIGKVNLRGGVWPVKYHFSKQKVDGYDKPLERIDYKFVGTNAPTNLTNEEHASILNQLWHSE